MLLPVLVRVNFVWCLCLLASCIVLCALALSPDKFQFSGEKRSASGLSTPICLSKLAHAYLRRSYTLEAQTGRNSCINSNRCEKCHRNGHPTYSRGSTSPAPAIRAGSCPNRTSRASLTATTLATTRGAAPSPLSLRLNIMTTTNSNVEVLHAEYNYIYKYALSRSLLGRSVLGRAISLSF